MKIRLSPKHIRVRIDRIEAMQWLNGTALQLQIAWPQNPIQFTLKSHPSSNWELSSNSSNTWIISVPQQSIEHWLESEDERIQWNEKEFNISIEKDYPCEHKLSADDRTFTRPHDTAR